MAKLIRVGCFPNSKLLWGLTDSCRYLSSYSNDQFIHVSELPSDVFQSSLPRLPIPDLRLTLERYLRSQQALVDSSSLSRIGELARKFANNEGPALDKMLRQIDSENPQSSYISDFWFDGYLKLRDPVVINVSPGSGIVDESRPQYSQQLVRATNFVHAALRFRNAYRHNCLLPHVNMGRNSRFDDEFVKTIQNTPKHMACSVATQHGIVPIDMSHYPNMFASTRIPVKGRDRLQAFPDSKHIVVIRNGRFYTFDVYNDRGLLISPQQLYSNLKFVATNANESRRDLPLGLLTTMNRDKWADVRDYMIEQLQNGPSLETIDSSIFAVCLDSETPATEADTHLQNLCGNPAHRWFDKSFQMIFKPDGQASVNFEHSWGDGIVMFRLLEDVYKEIKDSPAISKTTTGNKSVNDVKEIKFTLDERLRSVLETAKRDLDGVLEKLDLRIAFQERFSKNVVKTAKLSPDSILQLSLQLAYHLLTEGGSTPTYESCSTATFKYGRTETIRSATCETRAACELIHSGLKNGKISHDKVFAALRECSRMHSQLVKEATLGKGWDRHLLALRILAQQSGLKMPALFEHKSYQNICHIILSTSTLPHRMSTYTAFGPVVPNGFGLFYKFHKTGGGCCVTAYRGKNEFTAAEMTECIEKSMGILADVTAYESKKNEAL